MKRAVVDTGFLSALFKAGHAELIQKYFRNHEVIVTEGVLH